MLAKFLATLAVAASVTVFVACESEPDVDESVDVAQAQDDALFAAIKGRGYVLVDFEIDGIKYLAVEGFGTWSRPAIWFSDQGVLKGSTGMNSLDSVTPIDEGGPVSVEGGRLIVESLAQSSLGCEGCETLMAQEATMVQVLLDRPAIELNGQRLILSTTTHRATFIQPVAR